MPPVRADRSMLIRVRRRGRAALAACAALVLLVQADAQKLELPAPRQLAPGILFYTLHSTTLVTPPEPMSVSVLQLDPAKVELRAALANDEIMGTEVVSGIAERHGALAAINAGFFLANGDPAGVLTLNSRLVSDTRRRRGAVGILRDTSGVRLIFARLGATASLVVGEGRSRATVPIDGIDTTRVRGRLMLFTPSYNEDTDTSGGGLEWVADRPETGRLPPRRIVSGPHREGRTRIPADGFVLSFGGEKAPPPLSRLKRGTRVTLETSYDPVEGEPEPWSAAQDIVGGAGLLIREGRDVDDWRVEAFGKGFAEARHPRTMIGAASDGTIWLVTIDGRQPKLSVGMTLPELRTFARRLGLANALNLDGGGSTTMWVKGEVVNSPSDAAGPRKVSDALIVRSAVHAAVQGSLSSR
jgi:hypothetical protein